MSLLADVQKKIIELITSPNETTIDAKEINAKEINEKLFDNIKFNNSEQNLTSSMFPLYYLFDNSLNEDIGQTSDKIVYLRETFKLDNNVVLPWSILFPEIFNDANRVVLPWSILFPEIFNDAKKVVLP